MAALDFKAGFDGWIKATDKKWGHDRSKSVGASEAFGCLRKVWFSKNNFPQDPNYEESWGAMRRGDVIENAFVAPAMTWFMENMTEDAVLLWAGADQKTLIHPKAPLSATPDGLVIYVDDDALANYGIKSLGAKKGDLNDPHLCFNLEIKSIDPRVNLKEEKAIHRGQTIVQMGLTRLLTKHKPNYAVILYIDASFFDDIEIFVVPYDQQTFDAAVARSKQVYEIKTPGLIMAEGKVDNTCEYCKFKVACAQTNKAYVPTEGEANERNTPSPLLMEFEQLVKAERAASSAKKAAEKEQKAAAETLKQWLRDTGVRVAEADGIKCSISWIKGRKTLSKALIVEAGLNPEDYMLEGEGHDRLNISEKGSRVAEEE